MKKYLFTIVANKKNSSKDLEIELGKLEISGYVGAFDNSKVGKFLEGFIPGICLAFGFMLFTDPEYFFGDPVSRKETQGIRKAHSAILSQLQYVDPLSTQGETADILKYAKVIRSIEEVK